METCQITQTHRPPRLGFVIPYDRDKIVEYIRYISASAGGIYHFIFPYKDADDFKKWDKFRKPKLQDYIFHDENVPSQESVKWRDWPGHDKRFVLEYKDYPESYLSFIDVASFYQEWQFLPDRQTDKSELISLKNANSDALFPLIIYGDLPSTLSFQFRESWKRLGAIQHEFKWEDYLNPFSKPKKIGPLQFTRAFLNVRGNLDPSGIFYIADPSNLDDLLEFWNLRALGHEILFLPADLINEAYLDLKKWDDVLTPRYKYIKPGMEQWYRPNVIFGSKICNNQDEQDRVIGVLKKGLESLVRITRPVFRYNHYDQYPRAKFVYFSEDSYPGHESSKEIKSISKSPFPNNVFPVNQKWLTNFSVASSPGRERHPEKLPELTIESERNLFKRVYYRTDHIHISDGGLSVVGQFDNHEYHLPKINVLQIVTAVAGSQEYDVALSKPGNNVDLILKTLGGLQSDGRILKIKGVRDVISASNKDQFIESDLEELFAEDPPESDKLIYAGKLNEKSLKGYLKKILSLYHEKIVNEEFTGIKYGAAISLIGAGMGDTREMCIAPYKQADSQQFILKQMIAQNIMELGFNFECKRKHACWYPASKLSETIECRICGARQKILDPQRSIQWAYQTKGMFRLKNNAEGSISVIVSLWRLMHSLHDATFTPNIEVARRKAKERPFEVDYIVHVENVERNASRLIIGEAKSLNSLVESDMDSMDKALVVFGELNPAVCFSTLKDKYSLQEIALIREFKEAHPDTEVLTFVRKQLDVYDLYECGIGEYGLKDIARELYKANIET